MMCFFNLILVFGGMAGMPPQMWPQPPVQPHQPNVAQPGWLRLVFSIRKTKKFIQLNVEVLTLYNERVSTDSVVSLI